MRVPPPDEVVWSVNPPAPIVTPVRSSAVAPLALTVLLPPVTAIVPPPFAVNAVLAPVESVRPPEKVMVAPVLPVSRMPCPGLSVTAPVNVSVEPASAELMLTALPEDDALVTVPP